MTPEEKAKEIVWACVCVTPSEQVDLERNIAQAIREAVKEREREFSEAMARHIDTAIREAVEAREEEIISALVSEWDIRIDHDEPTHGLDAAIKLIRARGRE